MKIQTPYCLFIGDATEPFSIKLAMGIAQWRPDLAVGEFALAGCKVSTGLNKLSLEQAVSIGAKTFVLGFANNGGTIEEKWIPLILQAIELGMDIASGLHQRLTSFPQILAHAKKYNANLIDVRHPNKTFKTGTGMKRQGKRLLAVGTDCSTGKMFTTLAIHRELQKRKLNSHFRATGQSGIFIEGDGIAVDCVISDFIAGAVEELAPSNDPDHWDIIEGQGSLYHPAFAGVSLGLIHGAQPDALVLCHIAEREHMRGIPGRQLPRMQEVINANLQAARVTNSQVKFVGISVNTSMIDEAASNHLMEQYQQQFSVPCVDPLRHGVVAIVDQMERL